MEKEKLKTGAQSRFMKKVLFLLLAMFLGTFLVIEGFILYFGQKETNREADVLIILGARLYGEVPSPALRNRLDRGAAYLLEHPDSLVIVSGGLGRGEEMTEAAAMEKYLKAKGIQEHRIVVEEKSFNTYENISFSLQALRERRPDLQEKSLVFALVTNDFHVFRSVLTARDFGLDAMGMPAKTPPSIILKSYVREYLSVLKYLILDRPKTFQNN